ncbi:MAG: lysylphosphatidylglycerol synthase transmembrane domain-containing protein, partial [Myxococcota bacterium]
MTAEPDPRSPSRLRLLVRLIGPAVLIAVLWRLEDPGQLWSAVRGAQGSLLLAAAALSFVIVQLKVSRWQLLLRLCDRRVSTRDGWRALMPSIYLGLITPGRVGDLLKVQYLRHDQEMPTSKALAVVVMDRLCDVYVLLVFVALGIGHFATALSPGLRGATWFAFALTACLPAVILVRGPVDRMLVAIHNKLSRSTTGAETFLGTLRGQLRPTLLLAGVPTVSAFLVQYLQGWLAARALGL